MTELYVGLVIKRSLDGKPTLTQEKVYSPTFKISLQHQYFSQSDDVDYDEQPLNQDEIWHCQFSFIRMGSHSNVGFWLQAGITLDQAMLAIYEEAKQGRNNDHYGKFDNRPKRKEKQNLNIELVEADRPD